MARRFAAEGPRGLVLADLTSQSCSRRWLQHIGGIAIETDVSSPDWLTRTSHRNRLKIALAQSTFFVPTLGME